MNSKNRNPLARRLSNLRHQLAYIDALPQLTVLGTIVGCLAALIIVAFRGLIDFSTQLFLDSPENFESLSLQWRFLTPVIGALLIAVIFQALPKRHMQVGVSFVLDRLYNHQSHLPSVNMIVQFFAAAICIISGQSVGREGPAVHLGAGIASSFGRNFKLPNNSLRTLTAAGIAAAIAASFNTPLAGVIFAMEVVLMEYTIAGFVPIIMASFAGALITRLVFGTEFVFTVQGTDLASFAELPFLVGFGLGIGVLATLFSKVLLVSNPAARLPIFFQILLGGIITGAIALYVPEVLGLGYDTVEKAMLGEIAVQSLLIILIAKIIATGVTLNLGMPGGLIGPTLFIGALIGAVMGAIGGVLFDGDTSSTSFYVLLGMTASFGAVLAAPLTALITILELTNNPTLIFPSMLVVVISCLTTRFMIGDEGIFIARLTKQGKSVKTNALRSELNKVGVRSIMDQNFVTSASVIDYNQAVKLLENRPRWIVINSSDTKEKYVLRAVDFANFIESPPESVSLGKAAIELLEVPGKRFALPPLHERATLLEAHLLMETENTDAVYIQNHYASPLEDDTFGIITHESIRNYYSI